MPTLTNSFFLFKMPNWCENEIQIIAKEETITWIEKNLHEHCGRTWDEAATSSSFFCTMGNEVWYELSISVRTSGCEFSKFLDLLLTKFKNIHFKGHFYVEGGFGGGDYEEGTDEAGNRYQHYTPIPDSYTDYCEEEYYNIIQEVPQEGELEWDEQRIQQPHDECGMHLNLNKLPSSSGIHHVLATETH